jgi:phosphate:Na+ symporter
MDTMEDFEIWRLLAGLGIFLFGIYLLEEAIRLLAGKAFKTLIRRSTNGKLRSIFSGMLATAILQSSSAVSLIALAFVGAGLMPMLGAVGVVMGSNLGTTFTAWLIATVGFTLSIEKLAFPFIALGGLGRALLTESKKYALWSQLLLAFGLLFLGLDYMKEAVQEASEVFELTDLEGYGGLLYLLFGVLLTAIMQASLATMVLALTAIDAGWIDFRSAALLVIGANIGTTITILLGALGAGQAKKRVAFSHLGFNLVTAVAALLLLPWLSYGILEVMDLQRQPAYALTSFHTLFNGLGVLLFYPFMRQFAQGLSRAFPDEKKVHTRHISHESVGVSEAALESLRAEIKDFLWDVFEFNLRTFGLDFKLLMGEALGKRALEFRSRHALYEHIKVLHGEIFAFAAQIQQGEVKEEESEGIHRMLHAARMALHSGKTLKDIAHNLEEMELADNLLIRQLYETMKRRMLQSYVQLSQYLESKAEQGRVEELLEKLNNLRKEDKSFVEDLLKEAQKGQLSHLELSTALIVNRAAYQSTRQMLFALRESTLDESQIEDFDKMTDVGTFV